jgi:lipopolysaccharide transport system permease protein
MSAVESAFVKESSPRDSGERPGRSGRRGGSLIGSVVGNRDLIWQMAKRDVVGRYKGSALGLLWSFFNPLLMLCVYTFAFGEVFGVSTPDGKPPTFAQIVDYALFIFAGMTLFAMFSEVITRAPLCVVQNSNYVKKIVFPLQVFPVTQLVAALIHMGISTLLLVIAVAAIHGTMHWTILLAPIAVLPLALSTLGLAWILASLGVYVRDVGQAVSIVVMMLMYLSPVFYSVEKMQEKSLKLVTLMRLNPLTIPVEGFRGAVLYGTAPWAKEPLWFAGHCAFSVILLWCGFYFFERTKRGFADVV